MAPCCQIVDQFIIGFREKRWYWTVKEILKLVWHFVSVVIVLVVGAVCFWHLESTYVYQNNNGATTAKTTKTVKVVDEVIDEHEFMDHITTKYKLNIAMERAEDIYDEFKKHFETTKTLGRTSIEHPSTSQPHHPSHTFSEWFYFTSIVAMTIGYGDYTPETDGGKLFCIFFTLLSIPLMFTFLIRCGKLLTTANTHILAQAIKSAPITPRQKANTSPEGLSAILLTLAFLVYIHIGVARTMTHNDWGYVDSIYFWVITFSTVGFGDLLHDISEQNQLMPYRFFGLVLLSGLIVSVLRWKQRRSDVTYRTKELSIDGSMENIGDLEVEDSIEDGMNLQLETTIEIEDEYPNIDSQYNESDSAALLDQEGL